MQVFGYSRILTQSKCIVLWLSFVFVESTSRKHLGMSADGPRVNELFATRNPSVHQPWQKFTRIRALTRPWKEDRSFWNRLKWSSCWAGECLSVIRRGRRLHHVMQGSFCDAFCENDLGRGPLLDQLVTHIHRIPSTSSSARPSALHATRGGFRRLGPRGQLETPGARVCLMLESRRLDRGGRKVLQMLQIVKWDIL